MKWDFRKLRSDLTALVLLAVTVFVGLSMLSFDLADPPAQTLHPARSKPLNLCGEFGAQLAYYLRASFGMASWFVLVSLAVFDFRLMTKGPDDRFKQRIVGGGMMLLSLCVASHLLMPGFVGGQDRKSVV